MPTSGTCKPQKISTFNELPVDVAWNLAPNLDAKSLASLGKAWRPMYEVLHSNQAAREHLKLQLYRLGLMLGSESPSTQRPPSEINEEVTRFSLRWSSLQFLEQHIFSLPEIPDATEWMDGTIRPGIFMGESGGCLYSVQRGNAHVWRVFVYKFPAARTGTNSVRKWDLLIPIHPHGVAIDVEQDIIVFVRSVNASYGEVHTYNLSTGQELYQFRWDAPLERNVSFSQVEIKGCLVAIGIKTKVHWNHIKLPVGPSQLRIFNWQRCVMIEEPVDGSTIWGFQFLDQDTILIAEVATIYYTRPRLRVVKLKSGGVCWDDEEHNYNIEIPHVEGRIPKRILLIPNVTPTGPTDTSTQTSFNMDPEQRLIGFRFQYEDPQKPEQEVIVLANIRSILDRNVDVLSFLYLDPSEVYGEDFKLCGRRLIWSSGGKQTRTFHVQDFNPLAAELYLKGSPKMVIQHPDDQSWQTTMIKKEVNTYKGKSSVYTQSVARYCIRKMFPTQDNFVMIAEGEAVGTPGMLAMWFYCF